MVVTSGQWFSSGCGGPQARWLANGRIEIQGEGTPEKALPAAVKQWSSLISTSATKYGLWPHFVAGVMATESGGNQQAKTFCCYGLMGFLPSTATWLAERPVSADELLSNPSLSVDLGAKFIDWLMKKYNNNPIKVSTAYNAGSVKCGAPKNCPDAPNRWNVVADCAQGKAVDYAGRIIGYSNSAQASGLFDGKYDLSGLVPKSSFMPLVVGAALAGGAAWWWKNKR